MKPAAPVTSTLLTDESALHRVELVDCLQVVIWTADVEPISGEPLDAHAPTLGQKIAHQCVEAIESIRRNTFDDGSADHVNAHADFVFSRGLLLKILQHPSFARN